MASVLHMKATEFSLNQEIVQILPIICTPLAAFPFTFKPIGSIISHHDILQLIGSVMLRLARSEGEILAQHAERSRCQAIEQDDFGLRRQLLTGSRISPGVTV